MMSSRGSTILCVAVLFCIGGILIENVEAQCSTVTNCATCGSPETGVCTSCSSALFGLDKKTATSTVCTDCSRNNTNNCSQCVWANNCTRCKDISTFGPDFGLGSCSPCGDHCANCGTAGGGKCNRCAAGWLLNAATQKCESCSNNCSSCATSGASKCDVCADGYGLHTDTHLCGQCNTGCAKCARNITQCTQCTASTDTIAQDGTGTCTEPPTTAAPPSNCPIILRSVWQQNPLPAAVTSRPGPSTSYIFHMTFTKPCTDDASCNKRLRAIEKFQINSAGQSCIAYNLLIGNGKIYEGRGVNNIGNFTKQYDNTTVHVGMIGTYTVNNPDEMTINAITTLFGSDCLTALNVASTFKFYTHYDVACTRCPGKAREKLKSAFPDKYGGDQNPCPKAGRPFLRPMK